MKIKSVTIVGGGSAGWMTAALLSKYSNVKIILVESKKIKTIGVGESTLQKFNELLNRLELDDSEWMPKCKATYKTSIAFKNWREGQGERFQYPFGRYDLTDTYKSNAIEFFLLRAKFGKKLYPYEEFSRFVNHNTFIAEKSKIPINSDMSIGNFNLADDIAYHLDAELFGKYLRDEHCIPNGVIHKLTEIKDVIINSDGGISKLITVDNENIESDLYVDCTGFKSLLLEKYLNVPFYSFENELFNDSAIKANIKYNNIESEMSTYTDNVALNNGWCWNIPLWDRIGTGYVYSSKYTSQEKAENEFKQYLSKRFFKNKSKGFNSEVDEKVEFEHIKIKHGKHDVAWKKNCVAIGLSYGFLEPLESTGLLTSHQCAIVLCDTLVRRDSFVTQFDIDFFNNSTDAMMDTYKNFVLAHYTLSQRTDTEYWRDCLKVSTSKDSMNKIMKFDSSENDGLLYIAAGLGNNPLNEKYVLQQISNDKNVDKLHEQWQQHRKTIMKWVDNQPTHYQFLKDNIYSK